MREFNQTQVNQNLVSPRTHGMNSQNTRRADIGPVLGKSNLDSYHG